MVKQLVVVNMAVPMDFSQLSVQVAHASMLGILNQGSWINETINLQDTPDYIFHLSCANDRDLETWLRDHFTLILCKVWGKKAIMDLKAEAESMGLNTAVMEDYGHTTALAIGPASEEKLVPFKRLTLL